MMEQMMPFYVGQEVEAVRSHSEGAFKKGDRFVVQSVTNYCRCGWLVAIGIQDPSFEGIEGYVYICSGCGAKDNYIPNQWKFKHTNFRAITPAYEAVTFEKIEEPLPSLN